MKVGRFLRVSTGEDASGASDRNNNENENENNHNKQNNEEEDEEPMSLMNKWMLHSSLQCLAILEWNEGTDAAQLREFWLAVCRQFPRISCIAVDMDKHFLFGKLPEEDKEQKREVEEYISKQETIWLDRSESQWEMHILHSSVRSVAVFKFHHSLADGVSMIPFLLGITRSANDPSQKPRLPSASMMQRQPPQSFGDQLLLTPMKAVADAVDLGLRMLGLRCDTIFPRQQVIAITETQTGDHRSLQFSLPLIKSIKNMMAATVNDVISGIIINAFKRYPEIREAAAEAKVSIEMAYERRFELVSVSAMSPKRQSTKFTVTMPVNTRALAALREMQETIAEKSEVSWGNHFVPTFLDICLESGDTVWDAIRKVKRICDSKKKSAYLQLSLMHHLTRHLKVKTTLSCWERACSSASLAISNVVGPAEKICLSSYRVTNFRFSTAPAPFALTIYITSYVDEMTLNVVAFKPFTDINIFCKCLDESFVQVASAVKTID